MLSYRYCYCDWRWLSGLYSTIYLSYLLLANDITTITTTTATTSIFVSKFRVISQTFISLFCLSVIYIYIYLRYFPFFLVVAVVSKSFFKNRLFKMIYHFVGNIICNLIFFRLKKHKTKQIRNTTFPFSLQYRWRKITITKRQQFLIYEFFCLFLFFSAFQSRSY